MNLFSEFEYDDYYDTGNILPEANNNNKSKSSTPKKQFIFEMSDRYKNNNVKTPKFSFNFISQHNNGNNNNNNSNQNNEKKINKDKLEEEDGFDTDHDINMVNNSFSNKQKYDRNNDNIPNNIDDLIQEHVGRSVYHQFHHQIFQHLILHYSHQTILLFILHKIQPKFQQIL